MPDHNGATLKPGDAVLWRMSGFPLNFGAGLISIFS